MKTGNLWKIGIVLVSCTGFIQFAQAWTTSPNIALVQGSFTYYNQNNFAMSIVLGDFNHDGDQEIIKANYRYPYDYSDCIGPHSIPPPGWSITEIGDCIVGYNWISIQHEFTDPVPFTDFGGNEPSWDCLVAGDGDADGDLDLLAGAVQSRGNDGGAWVALNQYNPRAASHPSTYAGLFHFYPTTNPLFTWHNYESYDCHTVRWVDYNADGWLDVATLEPNGILRIYLNIPIEYNSVPTRTWNELADYTFYVPGCVQNSLKPPELDETQHLVFEPELSYTTMEFGDMDGNQHLDLFLNTPDQLRIFKNLFDEPGTPQGQYYNFDPTQATTSQWCFNQKEDAFCASFGKLSTASGPVMALAVGSFTFKQPHEINDYGQWRNDVFILQGNALVHAWQSAEDFQGTQMDKTQLVSDIQWADVNGNGTQDLVTCSYGLCTGVGDPIPQWDSDRGREMLYLDPQRTASPTTTPQPCNWKSANSDLSTSLALGDIEDDLEPPQAVTFIETVDVQKRLFYLSKFPLVRIKAIEFLDDAGVPLAQWLDDEIAPNTFPVCYDPLNGWVSIDHDYLTPTGAVTLRITYIINAHYDLVVGNDGQSVVYQHDVTTTVTPARNPEHDVTPMNALTNRTYNESHFIPTGNQVDLIAPDAIGANFNGFVGTYADSAEKIAKFMQDHPKIKRIDLGAGWGGIEMFQGHYFWGQVDECLEAVRANGGQAILFSIGEPSWALGDYGLGIYEMHNRPADERLHTMYVRNLVNRYRPEGIYRTFGNTNWGDWGVKIYQFENEPNAPGTGYGEWDRRIRLYPLPTDHAIKDIAEKIFREYQMIKNISAFAYSGNQDSLEVISPNWGALGAEYWDSGIPPGTYQFAQPPMPYINAVNDVALLLPDMALDLVQATNIIQQYTDYTAQQTYCGVTVDPPSRVDPFNPATVPGHPNLRLGLDNLFWSYYTRGLADYTNPTDPHPELWEPVFYGEEVAEHPFFVYEWTFECDWWNQDDDRFPKETWTAAELAKLFSIDVFPEEQPPSGRDHRLLKWDVSCTDNFWMGDSLYWPIYNQIAERLNDPNPEFFSGNPLTGSHVRFYEYEVIPTNASDPEVFRLTYLYHTTPMDESDRYTHFLKTCWDILANPADLYVNNSQSLWNFQDLKLNYTFPGTPKVNCYTPTGGMFQKDVEDGTPDFVRFAAGEMGPTLLTMEENSTQPQTNNDQSLSLHPGWNLVSWHIQPYGNLGDLVYINQMLPANNPAYYWFHDNGELYKYDNMVSNWPNDPNMGSQPWNLPWAYYMHMSTTHNWNEFTNKLPLTLTQVQDFVPSNAWAHNQNVGSTYASYWFFMGFAAPGYCKLASEPIEPLAAAPNGDPINFNFEGPFHWLVWQNDELHNYPPYDLKIVKTDDGKVYIPNAGLPHRHVDRIGTLEPGRGYFLGFSDDGPYTFDGWELWPQWQNDNYNPSQPKSGSSQLSSTSHFQYQSYTHWSYQVVIDTVDLTLTPIESGDQVGVFDGERCVGAASYSGEFPLVITCWEDDIATPMELDGYIFSDPMTFLWYDASENSEIEFVPPPQLQACDDDPVAPVGAGFGCGLYGRRSFTNGIASTVQLPLSYQVGNNYPNPFNAETIIPLELPERSHLKIELFNVRGQSCGVIFNGVQNAGWPKLHVNASHLTSGVYFYRVIAEGLERGGKFQEAGKMVVLK